MRKYLMLLVVLAVGACSDAGTPPGESCGDGECNGAESDRSCPGDCPASCNGACETPNDCRTCLDDCPIGELDTLCPEICGNGACESFAEENAESCPSDCAPTCGDGVCA